MSQSRRFSLSRGRYKTEWYFYSDIILLSSADKFDYAYNVSTIETRSDDLRVQNRYYCDTVCAVEQCVYELLPVPMYNTTTTKTI